jgi:hypothetical protein
MRDYRYYDPSGGVHRFPLYRSFGACGGLKIETRTAPALDASGYIMDQNWLVDGQPKQVIAPDGTTVWKRVSSVATGGIWDSNGNYLCGDGENTSAWWI